MIPPFANRQNCSHNRAAKQIKISCLPRESSLNYSWPSWILPQVIRDIHISPRLSCPWFLADRSTFPRAFTGTPESPDIKYTNDYVCLRSYIQQILPSFSSSEPAILLACGRDRELWPDPIFWECLLLTIECVHCHAINNKTSSNQRLWECVRRRNFNTDTLN